MTAPSLSASHLDGRGRTWEATELPERGTAGPPFSAAAERVDATAAVQLGSSRPSGIPASSRVEVAAQGFGGGAAQQLVGSQP